MNFPDTDDETAGALLTIDLGALVANYRRVAAEAPRSQVAGIVKADAYGLGLGRVAPALANAGCTIFFVADAVEGAALRKLLPSVTIYVTSGLVPGAGAMLVAHGLRPCLGSLAEIGEWQAQARKEGRALSAALHFDTGLNRLGLAAEETKIILADRNTLADIDVALVMSHLACADEPGHPLNAQQLARFQAIRAEFPTVQASFANTAGVFLGAEYQFDLVRPGYGIYGGAPVEGRPNPFRPTICARARVLSIREVAPGESAGYGATWKALKPSRLAVLSAGYADGYFRSLASAEGHGRVYLGGQFAPVAGRVSMDLLIVDISGLPPHAVRRGDLAELVGPHISLNEVAASARTIGYEVLTSLGARYKRHYIDV